MRRGLRVVGRWLIGGSFSRCSRRADRVEGGPGNCLIRGIVMIDGCSH